MIELKIENDSRDPKLYHVFVNDEQWKTLHKTVIFHFDTKQFSSCENVQQLNELFDVFEYKKARNYTIKRLAQLSLSTHDLRRLMTERQVSNKTIDRVLMECLDAGYIDDERWLESFYRVELAKKNGPEKIKQKLLYKGFTAEEIEHLFEETDQAQFIQKLLDTKFRSRNLDDPKEKQKVIASLIRRGFHYDQIKEVIRNHWS